VALIMLVVGSEFPSWWPFLVASYARNYPTYQLVVVHTGAHAAHATDAASAAEHVDDGHVRYVHVPVDALKSRFVEKIGATRAQVDAKFASGKGLSDLKPLYGRAFDDLLPEASYTHWGWVDWDLLLGDLSSVVPEELLWSYEALTFPGATLGFAWAGQLSIFRNRADQRTLYTVVPNFVELGFTTGSGEGRQSGWEERVLLRETLRKRPAMSILFHMAAQFDYKAQWLTWVPFDHFWDRGKIWRCAKLPLSRRSRPPLLVANYSKWRAETQQIVADPEGFYKKTDRVCIRWDLDSSPWRCCPHSTGVSYAWRDGRRRPQLSPHPNASAATRARLATLAPRAAVRPREKAYDVCQEGAFFHAGLSPRGSKKLRSAPRCTGNGNGNGNGSAGGAGGTWALQDDIGRFSGSISVLEQQPPDSEGC
jgi:hypothetical protein